MAAKLLGLEQVPVDRQDYVTEIEEWADLIADNRFAELAEMDEWMLLSLLDELDNCEISMLTGDGSLLSHF